MKDSFHPSGRLMSLDALRGFDMFWIMGAEGIVHALKDATGWGWAFFFAVIGMNPVTIYMATGMINFWYTSEYLFGGIARLSGENRGRVILAAGVVLIEWGFLYFLYRKKIFLRV